RQYLKLDLRYCFKLFSLSQITTILLNLSSALMKRLSMYICILHFFTTVSIARSADRQQVLHDSTIRYGVEIEPFLKSLNKGKIVEGFNYSPHINKFLKENKYVKFPPYPLTVGIDESFKGYKSHLVVNSGNRLY